MFSIIMPAYNSEKFIEKSIKSVINQTYNNWELIIIDDKSDDETCKIVEDNYKNDKRIILHKLKENNGPAQARNFGINVSKGRYIAFVDSDDIWMPDKLEKQLNIFEKEDCAICFTSYIKVFKDNALQEDKIVKSRKILKFQDMLWLNYIGCSSAVYDTKKCGKVFMPPIRYAEDYSMWLLILKDGSRALGIEEPLVRYNVRANSESQSKIKAAFGHWRALNEYGGKNKIKTVLHFAYYAFWHLFMILMNKLKPS